MSTESATRPNYVAAAFNARPLGMPVPPNWLALVAFGLLGAFLSPGWWLIGAGLEAAYLWITASSETFRRRVDEASLPPAEQEWARRRSELLGLLDTDSEQRQQRLEQRAAELARLFRGDSTSAVLAGDSDLARLCWLHLRLLVARSAVAEVVAVGDRDQRELERRAADLRRRLAKETGSDELRASLQSQLDLISARRGGHGEADTKLAFIEAELDRLAQQVELAREQALLATDATGLSGSMDLIGDSLGHANRWLREQRELMGHLDYLNDEPAAGAFLRPAQEPRTRT